MAPRPGMPHMTPAPAGGIPSRPVTAAQPAVSKPLFPSAAQVGTSIQTTPAHTISIVNMFGFLTLACSFSAASRE